MIGDNLIIPGGLLPRPEEFNDGDWYAWQKRLRGDQRRLQRLINAAWIVAGAGLAELVVWQLARWL